MLCYCIFYCSTLMMQHVSYNIPTTSLFLNDGLFSAKNNNNNKTIFFSFFHGRPLNCISQSHQQFESFCIIGCL